jgi:hypothetical protein
MPKSSDGTPAPRRGAEPTGDTLDRIAVRLRRIMEETQRMLEGGTASALTVQQTVRSIQMDVERLQRRHKPRAAGAARRG